MTLQPPPIHVQPFPEPDSYCRVLWEGPEHCLPVSKPEDYKNLLRNMQEQLLPCFEVLAFCLSPGKVQLVLKGRSPQEIFSHLRLQGAFPRETETFNTFLELSAQTTLPGGTLLGSHLRRLVLTFFQALFPGIKQTRIILFRSNQPAEIKDWIVATHQQALEHGMVGGWQWTFSSFAAHLHPGASNLARARVLELFGTAEAFREAHTLHPQTA
jgi:hypothetical protein